jgi:hypothetical protein
MPSRRILKENEYDSLAVRVTRASHKTLFVRLSRQLCPALWDELLSEVLWESTPPKSPYDWPAYDRWARHWRLTSTLPYRDWLRIFAWGLRPKPVASRDHSARALPVDLHWNRLVATDIDKARRSGKRDRLLRHRRDAVAVTAFVRFHILRQEWPEVLKHLPDLPSRDAARDLAHRSAKILSFQLRSGRVGRRLDLPTYEQVLWAQRQQPALLAIIQLPLDEWAYHDTEIHESLAEWTDDVVTLSRYILQKKRLGWPPSRILAALFGKRFEKGRRFGYRLVAALPEFRDGGESPQ